MTESPKEKDANQLTGLAAFWAELKRSNVTQVIAILAFALFCGSSVSADQLVSGAINPQISQDGTQIVFSYQGAIWKMPRAGGVMTRLTEEPGFDIEPAWSPDNKWIAFIRSQDFSAGILKIISTENGECKDFPRDVNAGGRLFFDPSGKRILGVFRVEREAPALCWLDIESGRPGPALLPNNSRQGYALSQDGRRIAIAFSRDLSGEQSGNNGPQFTVEIVPSEGGTPSQQFEFPARIYDLSWTENDQALCVVTNAGGAHNDLWRIPLDNPVRGAEKISFGQADEDRPTFSRDGRWKVYTNNASGPTKLIVRDRQTGLDQPLRADNQDFGKPTGTVRLTILDADSNAPITARISAAQIGGKQHAPVESIYRLQGSDLHFYADGESALTVPAGQYRITAWRGPEYRVTRQEVEVRADQSSNVAISLSRWINQRSSGWFSGESHIHANYGYGHWYNSPRTMLAQCTGEDLLVCNLVVANSDSDGVFDREYFRGEADPLSTPSTHLRWNEEFRSTIWGHLTLLNLTYLVEPIFTGFAHTTHPYDHPTNADVGHLVHDQHGHVNYTHPSQNVNDPYLSAYSAKALPLDIALGTVDSIDVMGSSHEANMELWYRLLNCGFRIPASAGTDCFLNRIRSRLPGSVRFYVHMDGSFSYDNWIEQFKKGATFATNGPMFKFTAGGKSLGETVKLSEPGSLQISGEVKSQFPLGEAEVVFNGKAVATIKPTNSDPTTISINQSIAIPSSGWIAIRAGGPRHPDSGSAPFGHTSAIYIEVEDHPNDASDAAEYFIRWIDRLWNDIQARDRIPSRHRDHVEKQITTARAVYHSIANQ